MANTQNLEPCNSCKKAAGCPVPALLAKVKLAWTAPDAIFDFPFVEVVSSWRQDNTLLIKLQCSRYENTRASLFTY